MLRNKNIIVSYSIKLKKLIYQSYKLNMCCILLISQNIMIKHSSLFTLSQGHQVCKQFTTLEENCQKMVVYGSEQFKQRNVYEKNNIQMTDEVKENLSWGRFFIRTFDACAIRTHIQILRYVGQRERRKHKIYREKRNA